MSKNFSFVKFVMISCGFVEPVNFVFSGEKKSKPCDFNQTWKQGAQYKHCTVLYGTQLNELPE